MSNIYPPHVLVSFAQDCARLHRSPGAAGAVGYVTRCWPTEAHQWPGALLLVLEARFVRPLVGRLCTPTPTPLFSYFIQSRKTKFKKQKN